MEMPIKLALIYYDQDSKLGSLQVTVREGVVRLSGIVDSEFERSIAIGIAQGIDGVKAVDSRIIVARDYR